MKTKPVKVRAVTYLVAAIVFLLVAVLGTAGGETVFLVLAMALVVLALNDWRRA